MCLICKREFDEGNFNRDPNRRDGRSPWCKPCTKEYKKEYYNKNKQKISYKAKLHRSENLEKIREYDRLRSREGKRRIRNRDTWRGKAVSLISSMRTSSKSKGFEWSNDWWDVDSLTARIENQCCERTGVPFELFLFINDLYKTNPLAPSVDRIDNTKGYSPDNVQIVTWFYNNMKRDHPQELVNDLIDAIVANEVIKIMTTTQQN